MAIITKSASISLATTATTTKETNVVIESDYVETTPQIPPPPDPQILTTGAQGVFGLVRRCNAQNSNEYRLLNEDSTTNEYLNLNVSAVFSVAMGDRINSANVDVMLIENEQAGVRASFRAVEAIIEDTYPIRIKTINTQPIEYKNQLTINIQDKPIQPKSTIIPITGITTRHMVKSTPVLGLVPEDDTYVGRVLFGFVLGPGDENKYLHGFIVTDKRNPNRKTAYAGIFGRAFCSPQTEVLGWMDPPLNTRAEVLGYIDGTGYYGTYGTTIYNKSEYTLYLHLQDSTAKIPPKKAVFIPGLRAYNILLQRYKFFNPKVSARIWNAVYRVLDFRPTKMYVKYTSPDMPTILQDYAEKMRVWHTFDPGVWPFDE